MLHGHERALTMVRYNRDGDLLITCSKDNKPTLWYAHNGERIGTYDGHVGTVWTAEISRTLARGATSRLSPGEHSRSLAPPPDDSAYLVTGSADSTARVWVLQTGELLATLAHPGSVLLRVAPPRSHG